MRRNAAPTIIRGLLHPTGVPIVRVEISGPSASPARGLAVLDTGATASGLDRSVATDLQLESPGFTEWHAIASGETRHQAPQRRARLRIGEDPRLWELDFIELENLNRGLEGYHVIVLLGWDFLDQCVFTCDGPSRTFSLTLPLMPPHHGPVSSGATTPRR